MQKRRRKTSKEERVCSICSQSFSKAEHLDRHIRSHTKEKPFRCSICGKVYARQDTLLRHSRSHRSPADEDGNLPISAAIEPSFGASSMRLGLARLGPTAADYDSSRAVCSMTLQLPEIVSQDEAVLLANGSSGGGTSTMNTITAPASSIGSTHGIKVTPPSSDETCATNNLLLARQDGVRECDLMPYWSPEDVPQWPLNILDGDELDFNEFDLSLFDPLTENAAESTLAETSATPSTNLSHFVPETTYDGEVVMGAAAIVQRSWHTFWSKPSSAHNTPASEQEECQVDELCRESLRDKLQPRPQQYSLPSISFLDLCLQAYFANFHSMFPIVHASLFKPNSQNGLLTLSMCSVGSLFLGSSGALMHGISMYERLNKANLTSWETLVSASGSANHVAFQAAVIGQTFGMLVGVCWVSTRAKIVPPGLSLNALVLKLFSQQRPKDLTQIELFHGTMVVWAQKQKLFRLDDGVPNIQDHQGQELEDSWKKWARMEEKKRSLLALFLQDTEISKLSHREPLMRQRLGQLPRTCSTEVFLARDAVSWKTLLVNQTASDVATSKQVAVSHTWNMTNLSTSNFPDVLNEFELCVMLERIGSMANDNHGAMPSLPQTLSDRRKFLILWYEKYRNTAVFLSQASSLTMLWHSIFMSLYMDLDILECAAGREGYEVALKHRQDAQSWAQSSQARRCIAHALLVQRQFEQMSLGAELPIHAPGCLFRCGIAWHIYIQLGSLSRSSLDFSVSMPELELLGIDGQNIFLSEVGSQLGRSGGRFLLRIVDLLRRITHWKIADGFATTLLSLAETQGVV